MIENIVNKTKLCFVTAATALSLYGCKTMQLEYPLTQQPVRSVSQCDDFNNRNVYCDRTFIYPAVVVRFK